VIRKKIEDLTLKDVNNILVWDIDEDYLTPFFFDPNQETLVPFYHDVVDASFYVRANLFKGNNNYIALVKFSRELFYLNDDFRALNCWYFGPDIRKLEVFDLPARIKINIKTYPFFNNYFIFIVNQDSLIRFGNIFFNFVKQFCISNDNLSVLLTGDLGSGKTSFVRTFLSTSSPSFNIMYSTKVDDLLFNHWDLYRLDVSEDILNSIDFWLYLNNSGVVNLIEWANKIKLEFYLKNVENMICINFAFGSSFDSRVVTISGNDNIMDLFFKFFLSSIDFLRVSISK